MRRFFVRGMLFWIVPISSGVVPPTIIAGEKGTNSERTIREEDHLRSVLEEKSARSLRLLFWRNGVVALRTSVNTCAVLTVKREMRAKGVK